ncbi:odorant receptor Or2-like [Vanessa cardui]|uniref:odorant receptor Or2-like n=1 Tax=Vanessa cardui TaxID=171605 RepID=UPI001F141A0A|nr:odorant receptor Or2-like [Vanessa cardui]
MIHLFVDNIKDPQRPLLAPNYWILRKIGLILPENKINKVIFVIIHELVTVFVITQYMELYLIRSDLDLVITNLKVSIVSFICIVKTNTFVFWQSSWKEVIDYVTEADNNERKDSNTAMGHIISSYTTYCRRLLKFYWTLILSTFFCVTGTPLIRYLSSSNYRDAISNGTEPFPHIFSAWVPFDKYSFPGSWVIVCLHIVMCAYGAMIMSAYDTIAMVTMVFFGGKLELLRERCKNMFGCDGSGVSDDQARTALRDVHSMHVHLMKYSKLFDSLLSPVMFLYVVMCSFMLCASAFQLTMATNTTQKLLMAQYLVFGIAQLFMFCWHSNNVLEQGTQVMMGPYESEWWVIGPKQKQEVLILTEQLRIFEAFSAGPFSKLTLSTFITILKGAYSYYALLRN